MSANATGVAARIESIPTFPRKLEPARHRLRQALRSAPLSAAAILLLALAALAAPLAWHDREAQPHHEDLTDAVSRLELIASMASYELGEIARRRSAPADSLAALARALPAGALSAGRRIVLADEHGAIVGAEPFGTGPARSLADLFGDAQPLTTLTDREGVMSLTLADGTKVIATVKSLPSGHLAVTQPLAGLRTSGFEAGSGTLLLAIAVAVGMAGLATAWRGQARRAAISGLAARRLQERVETSLTRGRCGLWDWDLARGRVSWSASMYELLGYEPRDTHLSFGELNAIIHPEDGDFYGLARRVAACSPRPLDEVFRARTAGGAWMWLRVRAEIVEDPADGGRHLVGIAVDVTDEQSASRRTAAADMRLRDAIEAISEAFVLWDENNRLVLCNSRFRKLHGLTPEHVQPGAAYADIMEAGTPPRVEHHLAPAATCVEGARTLDAQLSDGRWLHINERRTRDGGFVSVGTDITELKRHEGRLLASERRLLALVEDAKRSRQAAQIRAQQLAELAERYHEQKDEAESASRSKTEFLAKMSHELRTPLNAIIGFAELMQQQIMGPLGCDKYREYVGDIHGSGLSLLGTIDDIMRLSKIEAGGFSLSPAPLDAETLVRGAVAAIGGDAKAKGLTLRCDIAPTPLFDADGSALHQVLVQLLRNAIKFTPRGGAVRVRVRPADGALNIFVEDDGIGIPRTFLSRLGTPFEQAETEYSKTEKGCGLGLPLAKALTELHDGRLRIRSQEGVGTVVLVHLPRQRLLDQIPLGLARPYLLAAE